MLYRNYDGRRSTFGDTSVAASTANPDVVSAFAAERSSDGAITVMVINKGTAATPATIALANVTHAAAAQAWQLTAGNTITRVADVPVTGAHTLAATLPAQSVTLFVIPRGAAPTGPPAAPTGVRVVP